MRQKGNGLCFPRVFLQPIVSHCVTEHVVPSHGQSSEGVRLEELDRNFSPPLSPFFEGGASFYRRSRFPPGPPPSSRRVDDDVVAPRLPPTGGYELCFPLSSNFLARLPPPPGPKMPDACSLSQPQPLSTSLRTTPLPGSFFVSRPIAGELLPVVSPSPFVVDALSRPTFLSLSRSGAGNSSPFPLPPLITSLSVFSSPLSPTQKQKVVYRKGGGVVRRHEVESSSSMYSRTSLLPGTRMGCSCITPSASPTAAPRRSYFASIGCRSVGAGRGRRHRHTATTTHRRGQSRRSGS